NLIGRGIIMYQEINEKMKQAQQGIARSHKIDAMLNELEKEQEMLCSKTKELKAIMEREKYDVEKLEKTSIASVFYSILGSLDEHINKERKEALAAKLKYDQAVRDLDDVKDQISKLNSERTSYVDCQSDYDRLYAQKKEELIRTADETAQKILELINSLNLACINYNEITEAINAGNKVLYSLDIALEHLSSAEGWGTFDLLGGGLISDLAKHSHIDEAKAETEATQSLLRQFKTELADISLDSDIFIEMEGFAKFADFFFDGLITDWFMQSRIQNSQDSVYAVKSQVLSILEKLGDMESQENSNIEHMEAEIDELVLKA
ncbi:MAG: hypothetical protein AAGU75_24420, partial [Bacillota bacterium]